VIPGRHATHLSTSLEGIPGALIGMGLVYAEGMRRGVEAEPVDFTT
jgi:hypothetical protein